jgi:nitrate reductase (NAD(P)H)
VQVLPPHVDADKAAEEGWWQDPDYILYELPVNSTISAPAHDERVYLDVAQPYTMRGYAYSGGGRKITRVEVSFDGGARCTAAETNRVCALQQGGVRVRLIDAPCIWMTGQGSCAASTQHDLLGA